MDSGTARRIAALCSDPAARRIIEVGAGTGTLTAALLALDASVTALEIDPDLIAILHSRPDLADAQIAQADALSFDYAQWSAGTPWIATGNLPYNIATALLLGWIQMDCGPRRIVVMIQRDVADRLNARPGTAAYGSLTLAVQYQWAIRRALVLRPPAFYPQPKVDSAVVVLERRPVPAVISGDPQFLLKVVRAAFAYRRKTLVNSLVLALGLDRAYVMQQLADIGIAPEIRGEQLDLVTFAALADALAT